MFNPFKSAQGVAALVLTLGVMSTGAQAANGNNGAFLGGLALGVLGSAVVSGSGSSNYGYQPNGYYAQPAYQPQHCWWVVQPVYGAFGQVVGQQQVKRCNY